MFLRPNDRSEALRGLRAELLKLAPTLKYERDDVPHSFRDAELLRFARRALDKDISLQRRLDLLAALGRALGLCGHDAEQLECFETGYSRSRSEADRIRFLFHQGLYYHLRRGDARAARKPLEEAVARNPVASVTRANALLALMSACLQLNEVGEAFRLSSAILGMNIREIEPYALMQRAEAHHRAGDHGAFQTDNRAARRLFEEYGNELGVTMTDGHLGQQLLETGEPAAALALFEKVRKQRFDLLDLSRLGVTYNNEGVARRQLGDYDGAQGCFLDGLRFHVENNQPQYAAGTLRNLAKVADNTDRPELALALLVRSAQVAREVGNPSEQFFSLRESLDAIASRRIHIDAVPYLMSRCFALLDDLPASLGADSLRKFVDVTARVAMMGAEMPRTKTVSQPAGFPLESAMTEANLLTEAFERPSLRAELEATLREKIRIKRAPRADLMAGFLMGWAGTRFKNGDYQAEFLLTQETSKYHLRELRKIGVIAQIGTRKAAKYELNFHRERAA